MFALGNISTGVALWAAVWTSAALGATPVLEVIPAWGGLAREGKPTEFEIRVHSTTGGPAELHIVSGKFQERDLLMLRAQIPQTLHVAILVDGTTTVHVKLKQGQDLVETEQSLQPISPAQRFIAIASDFGSSIESQSVLTTATTRIRHFSPSSLPEQAQGYAVPDIVVIDQRTLDSLNRNQLNALLSFLGQCGRVAAIGIDGAASALLKQATGCRGQSFTNASPDPALFDGLSQLVAHDTVTTASYATIAPLAEDVFSDAAMSNMALVVSFAAYLATLIVLVRFAPATAVLTVAVVTTAIAAFAWSTHDAAIATLSWSELDAGDRSARTITAVSIQGQGRGSTELGFSMALGLPFATAPDSPIAIEKSADEQTYRLRTPTTLGSAARLWFEISSVVNDVPLSVTVADGNPVITNISSTPIENAVFLWQGQQFAVPRLGSGAHWILVPTATTAVVNPTLALASRRAEPHPAALLLPYVPESVTHVTPTSENSGWLLIRYSRAELAT